MQKTRIEWTDYAWNPIKGICPVGCWYCYARKMYKRFGWPQDLFLDGRVPILSNKKPSKIFICSTVEMFHPDVPKRWRDFIFSIIDGNPQHIFQILTKMPQNIDRPMPDNMWLGVSIANGKHDMWRLPKLMKQSAKIKFVSFEPLLFSPLFSGFQHIFSDLDWIITGRLTGHGKKYDPSGWSIRRIVNFARRFKVPIFLKDNLQEIWGEDLIQEMPE